MDVAPGTVVLWSDVSCPWAHVTVSRLWRTRAELGLDEEVRFDLRPFPLELFNGKPTPKIVNDVEVEVLDGIEPQAGWQAWQRPAHEYPVTVLLALEAVQAAKAQGMAASEQLDRALRRAFYAESRCISLRSVVLDVATTCEAVDHDALRRALDDGRARRAVIDCFEAAPHLDVKGSPHLFLPDGTDVHNPGIRMHWDGGKPGNGPLVIDADDPSVYRDLLTRAAAG